MTSVTRWKHVYKFCNTGKSTRLYAGIWILHCTENHQWQAFLHKANCHASRLVKTWRRVERGGREKKKKGKTFTNQKENKTRIPKNIKSDLQSKIKRERAMKTRHVTVQLIFNSKSISTATCKASWEKKVPEQDLRQGREVVFCSRSGPQPLVAN